MKLLSVATLIFFFSNVFSQVSRTDIEGMVEDLGTSFDKMENVIVHNYKSLTTTGNYAYISSTYSREKGNQMSLNDNGIKILYAPNGEKQSFVFIPYTTIARVSLNNKNIEITLKN